MKAVRPSVRNGSVVAEAGGKRTLAGSLGFELQAEPNIEILRKVFEGAIKLLPGVAKGTGHFDYRLDRDRLLNE